MVKFFLAVFIQMALPGGGLVDATEVLTRQDKQIWQKCIKRIVTTPPCCGACPILSMEDGRKIYGHITRENDSEAGRTKFEEHKARLMEIFKSIDSARFELLYSNDKTKEISQ